MHLPVVCASSQGDQATVSPTLICPSPSPISFLFSPISFRIRPRKRLFKQFTFFVITSVLHPSLGAYSAPLITRGTSSTRAILISVAIAIICAHEAPPSRDCPRHNKVARLECAKVSLAARLAAVHPQQPITAPHQRRGGRRQ